MKNLMRHLISLAVAIAAAAGCAKVETVISDFVPGEGTFTVVFTSEATKTGMERVLSDGETKYQYKSFWTKGDSIGVFVRCGQSEVNNNLMSSKVASDTLHKMKFSVSGITAPEVATRYDFYAYYPYSGLLGSDYRNVRVMVPVVQYPAHGSFDPKADVLSGYPTYRDVNAGTQAKTLDVELAFARRSSVVVLMPTVGSGLPDGVTSDSPVGEIRLTFSKPVAGVASMDIIDSTAFTLENIGSSRTVTLKYADGTHKLGDHIWVSVAPVREVEGLSFAFGLGDGRYLCADADWSAKPQTFKQGQVKKYDVPINETYFSQKQELREYYQRVDTDLADWCGKYLIVGEKNGTYYACNQEISGDWGQCDSVIVADGLIACSETTRTYEFTIEPGLEAGKYSILDYNGKYLSASAAKYQVAASPKAEDTDFTITHSLIQRGATTRQLKFSSIGGYRMKFYDSTTGNPIALYRLKSSIVTPEPEIGEVPDQHIGYQESVTRSFDVSITNVVTEPTVTSDGVVVTSASIARKGAVYSVTYSVGANDGLNSRSGMVTVHCGSASRNVNVIQDVNKYEVRIYSRVQAVGDVLPGRYIIVANTETVNSCLPCAAATSAPPLIYDTVFPIPDAEFRTADDSPITWEFTGDASAMTVKTLSGLILYNINDAKGTRVNKTEDTWTIEKNSKQSADNLFQMKDANNSRFIGLALDGEVTKWRSFKQLGDYIAPGSYLKFYRLKYYPITFSRADSKGGAISASTKLTTVIESGTEIVQGFTDNCSRSYSHGQQGLEIGENQAAGIFEMNINEAYRSAIRQIAMETAQYGSDAGTLSLFINGSDAPLASGIVPGSDFVYNFDERTQVNSIRITTSEKRAYVSRLLLGTW